MYGERCGECDCHHALRLKRLTTILLQRCTWTTKHNIVKMYLCTGYCRSNGHTAISRKVVGKTVTRQSGKVIWDMINTLFLTLWLSNLLLLLSFSIRKHTSMASRTILLNSKPPTIPFGILACTFSDNLLEIAVYNLLSYHRPSSTSCHEGLGTVSPN